MQIIPAIDIIDGKAVRLTKGDFLKKKVYANDPSQLAKSFADAGFSRLHVVDLDGAKAGMVQNLEVLESIGRATQLKIDFGGGIRSMKDVKHVLNAGADQCTVGSIAARQPLLFKEWINKFGADKFLVGADVLQGTVRISGWAEDSHLPLKNFLTQMINLGVKEFFCTDISKDGAMQGPAVGLYKNILSLFPAIRLIASGGVTTMNDLELLADSGCAGAIVGKAIYEGLISIKELAQFNATC